VSHSTGLLSRSASLFSRDRRCPDGRSLSAVGGDTLAGTGSFCGTEGETSLFAGPVGQAFVREPRDADKASASAVLSSRLLVSTAASAAAWSNAVTLASVVQTYL
jgi:hypothetical protein